MVSVCLATYNGSNFIYEQLTSILKQLKETDEIIISDDNSTDNTLDIIKAFADSRIKIFLNPDKGVISNFENALLKSSGNFIFLSDQDDVWMDNKYEVMLCELRTADMVISDAKLINENATLLLDTYFSVNKSKFSFLQSFNKNPYLGCCMAFNRKVLNKATPFPSNIPMHDIWIGMIAKTFFKVKVINEALLLYRRHGGNASAATEKSPYNFYEKLSFRLNVLYNLVRYTFK